jgi:hypothetical protein
VNPLGVKGIGEAGTIAATPAVVNAAVERAVAARHPPPGDADAAEPHLDAIRTAKMGA